jgi:hypothetical protein
VDAVCERYLAEVVEALADALGQRLVGTYLHGSAVLGGFDVRRSDLDVVAVCHGNLLRVIRSAVADRLAASAPRCPAAGLEFSLVTEHAVRHPVTFPAFETHLTTAVGDAKTVDGAGHAGDPDLILHFAVCRAAGRALDAGPPPQVLFAEVPKALILPRLAAELTWGVAHGSGEYAVLNACRAWRYAVDGMFVSKLDGGRWASHRCTDEDAALVAAAIARQRGTPVPLDADRVAAFVATVAARLAE